MDAPTTAMLAAFWGWASGVVSVVLLGLLVPAAVGTTLGMIPLAIARRDPRPVVAMLLSTAVSGGAACLVLAGSGASGPPRVFWAALSLQFGFLVGPLVLLGVLRLSVVRIRADRAALSAVTANDASEVLVQSESLEPGPRQRLNAIEAEYYIAEWMRFFGHVDAVVTPARRDGGVDVRTSAHVVQVKHRPSDFVSVDVVRAIAGVGSVEGRAPVVFTSGRYSREATEFAGRANVALFIFRPHEGRVVSANAAAQRLKDGLRSTAVVAPPARSLQH